MTELSRRKRLAEEIWHGEWGVLSRKDFKALIEHTLVRALIHFYMAEYAKLYGQTKRARKWANEAEYLVVGRVVTIVDQVTIVPAISRAPVGRWDKRKAIEEAVNTVKDLDRNCRRNALNYVRGVCRVQTSTGKLPRGVENALYELLKHMVDACFACIMSEPGDEAGTNRRKRS